MPSKWLRKKAYANSLGVSERTISRWIAMGLPSAKVGGGARLIHVDRADAWLESFMAPDDTAAIEATVDDILRDLR